MDDLIGFLIFVIIAAISVIGRINKERNAKKEIGDIPPPKFPMDELPEATRRMLFGDGRDIPTARPKHAPPPSREEGAEGDFTPSAPVPARRVVLREGPEWPAWQEEKPARPMMTAMPPKPAARPSAPPVVRRAPEMPPTTVQPRLRREVPREVPSLRRQVRQPIPPGVREPEEGQPRHKQPMPASQPPVKAPLHAGMAHPLTRGVGAALRSRSDLARALVLREVLGPPKAFEEMGF